MSDPTKPLPASIEPAADEDEEEDDQECDDKIVINDQWGDY